MQPFCFTGTTDEEKSLVCPEALVPDHTSERDDGWKGFRIIGQLDFSLIGILARISEILASNGIGIFAVSTFNTDYIFTKEENSDKALAVLHAAGGLSSSWLNCDETPCGLAAGVFMVLHKRILKEGKMIKIYGMPTCPYCDYVHEQIVGRENEFEYINIGENIRNMSIFTRMRDTNPVFDHCKDIGDVGVPAFVFEDGRVSLDPADAGLIEYGSPNACSVEDHKNGRKGC